MPFGDGIITFSAGEDLAAHRRVKIDTAGSQVPIDVIYADAGEAAIGVTEIAADDTYPVSVKLFTWGGTMEIEGADAWDVGATIYGAADGKASDTSSGSAIGVAKTLCATAAEIIEIIVSPVLSTTAATVSYADAGLQTDEVTVEAALGEVYTDLLSAQAIINLPLGGFTEADGTVLADFADATGTTPGWNAGDESFGIRWNNHANPDPISTSVVIPPDLDATADVVLHVLAAKVGATVGDAVTWLVEAFNNADAAVYDADADFGGTSSAMTGDATTKTCQEETLTLAAADVAASPCVMTLTIQPTDGTLGTDDVIILGAWLEYTRKLRTS